MPLTFADAGEELVIKKIGGKPEVKKHLEKRGIEYTDYGTYSTESCHYPIFAEKAARAVVSGECERGILFCGTGALLSPTSTQQGLPIPGVCHAVAIAQSSERQ